MTEKKLKDYMSVEDWAKLRKIEEDGADPVEIMERVLPILTKDEFYKIFWLVINHMVDNYANRGKE